MEARISPTRMLGELRGSWRWDVGYGGGCRNYATMLRREKAADLA